MTLLDGRFSFTGLLSPMAHSPDERTVPFHHVVVDDFLPDADLSAIRRIYDSLSFNGIHSDLYRFTQSNELGSRPDLEFFKSRLDCVLKQHTPIDGTHYEIFASCYRKGDHLLCHDDLVDGRLYAFTFYLADFPHGGELVLYNNECTEESRRIAIRANRLVVFKVSPTSFHEVARCHQDGRMAVSGWLVRPGMQVSAQPVKRDFSMPSTVERFELPMEEPLETPSASMETPGNSSEAPSTSSSGTLVCVPFEDVPVKQLGVSKIGPFVDRRADRIELETHYVPEIEGYELVHVECLRMRPEGYILTNDIVNTLDDPLDVFIFGSDVKETKEFIRYIGPNGEIEFELDAAPGQMLLVPRRGLSLCVMVGERDLTFRYMLYRRMNEEKA